MAIKCSGVAGKEGKVGILPSVLKNWLHRSFLKKKQTHNQKTQKKPAVHSSKAYGWIFKTKPTKETLWLVFTSGHILRRGCRWSILTSTTESITLVGPYFAGGLQPPCHHLEKMIFRGVTSNSNNSVILKQVSGASGGSRQSCVLLQTYQLRCELNGGSIG